MLQEMFITDFSCCSESAYSSVSVNTVVKLAEHERLNSRCQPVRSEVNFCRECLAVLSAV
jgi:hypothetical protein